MKPSFRHALFALAVLGAVSMPAHADEPTKEARVSAPSRDVAELLAKAKAALSAEQQAAFATAVADARLRLLANERIASRGEGERVAVDATIAAALADAGLTGKANSKLQPVYVALATMQLEFDLRDAFRDRFGRQLAIRAVKACKGEASCLDAIATTADMSADHIAAARKTKDLEAEDRLGNFELQALSVTVSRVKTSDKMQKAVLDFVKG